MSWRLYAAELRVHKCRGFGASGRNRTGDNGFTRAALYQLSYASMGMGPGGEPGPYKYV